MRTNHSPKFCTHTENKHTNLKEYSFCHGHFFVSFKFYTDFVYIYDIEEIKDEKYEKYENIIRNERKMNIYL